jgi:hypothetical protein
MWENIRAKQDPGLAVLVGPTNIMGIGGIGSWVVPTLEGVRPLNQARHEVYAHLCSAKYPNWRKWSDFGGNTINRWFTTITPTTSDDI